MVEARLVPYNDETHRGQFFELNHEFLSGADKQLSTRFGINLNPGGTVREYIENVFPTFTTIKPPDGIIYILEVNGEAMGMGVLRKLEEGVVRLSVCLFALSIEVRVTVRR